MNGVGISDNPSITEGDRGGHSLTEYIMVPIYVLLTIIIFQKWFSNSKRRACQGDHQYPYNVQDTYYTLF